MSIASFHQQVYLAGGHPLAERLKALSDGEKLRSFLKDPEDRAFWFWTPWA